MDIDINDEALREQLRRLSAFFGSESRELLEQLGFFAETQILTRTIEGKDFQGAAFEGYSAGYAKRRKAKGRPVSKADLFFSGRMQGLVTHKVGSDSSVRLFIAGGHQAMIGAAHHFGRGRVPQREWFDLNDQDIDQIHDMVVKAVEKIIS